MFLVVFAVSMFVSASLLFLVEPMMAKMALPMLGGSPAVWNTCLVFFQAVLLAGNLYSYLSTKWLGRRAQIALHLLVALSALYILPLHIPAGWQPPTESNPVFWVLGLLAIAVGLPFFLLSASTPMLQRWFSQSGHASAHDPYFLYAASNGGSLVGLLGYPLLVEPNLRLTTQSHFWSFGYVAFLVLCATCGAVVWRTRPMPAEAVRAESAAVNGGLAEDVAPRSDWRQRMLWIALAFVPSSLMMGVTTSLTTDIPAIPLFWVLPLALYLLSFVMVFASRPPISHAWMIRRLPYFVLVSLFVYVSKIHLPLVALFLLFLATLFAVALVCHGELARTRPPVERLTEFYLWVAVGGVLGGIFNSLLAPVLFSSTIEFPLVLILAALLRPAIDQAIDQASDQKGYQKNEQESGATAGANSRKTAAAKRNDFLLPVALGLSALAVIAGATHGGFLPSAVLTGLVGFMLCVLMFWCLTFSTRPFRFALGMAALFAAGSFWQGPDGKILYRERSFFGISRVTNSARGNFRLLIHNGTLHGTQSLDPSKSREPLSYFSRTGPAGSILRALHARKLAGAGGEVRKPNWALVGLGAGAMACYFEPGDSLTIFEIDPGLTSIAKDPQYFTFLSQCAPAAPIVLGDARLRLHDVPNGSYDLLVIDAFSGDSIPMHLITKEALALYMSKLAPGGVLAFHMSNHFLRLVPIFGKLAKDANLISLINDDTSVSQNEIDAGRLPSQWIVMARAKGDLGAMAEDKHWAPIPDQPGTQLWTDDYSNLLRVINWD